MGQGRREKQVSFCPRLPSIHISTNLNEFTLHFFSGGYVSLLGGKGVRAGSHCILETTEGPPKVKKLKH